MAGWKGGYKATIFAQFDAEAEFYPQLRSKIYIKYILNIH